MMQWVLMLFLSALILTGATAIGYKHGLEAGSQEIQTKWDAENAKAEIKSQELQTGIDKLRESKNRELARLNRTVAALSDSLRNRPERPDSAATASAGVSASGCTGAELYKPDSEFLVRESERADRIRLALIQCQAAYSAAAGQN